MKGKIRVFVRVRPTVGTEQLEAQDVFVYPGRDLERQRITLNRQRDKPGSREEGPQTFTFDAVSGAPGSR